MSKSITNTIKTEVPIYDTDDTDEEEGYSENLKFNCKKSAPIIPKLGNIYFIYCEMVLENSSCEAFSRSKRHAKLL